MRNDFDFKQAYRLLYTIRRTEGEIAERYQRDELMRCPTHLSIGQEAAAVGVMMALDSRDHVYSSHRCHAHYLAKGGDLNRMIAELHGKVTGCTGGWGGSMQLADESVGFMGACPVVGDCISLAVGSALAFKLDGSGRTSVAFFGDAAVETGQFWEAVSFAALKKLPIMFICENNQYATATHVSQRQPASPIYERVKPFMWTRQTGDSDVESVWLAASECRTAQPGFLEIATYRYREHVGPNYDWDLGYRTEKEVREHMAKDPVEFARTRLAEEETRAVERVVDSEVLSAFDSAFKAAWPRLASR